MCISQFKCFAPLPENYLREKSKEGTMKPHLKKNSLRQLFLGKAGSLSDAEKKHIEAGLNSHLDQIIHDSTPYIIVLLILTLIPLYYLSPLPQKWYQISTHAFIACIGIFCMVLKEKWRIASAPVFVIISEIIGATGYALALHTSLSGSPELSDIGFLSSLFVVMMITNILLFPIPNNLVVLSALYHSIFGIWSWSGSPGLKTMDWAAVIVGSAFLATALFLSKVTRRRHELLLEYRTLELTKENQKLTMAAIEKELELAQKIHDSFAPPEKITNRAECVINFYESRYGSLGGDWTAARELANGDLAILVVDVTGKGIGAALVIHAVQSVWAHSLFDGQFDPIDWIKTLNRTLRILGKRTPHTLTLGLAILSEKKLKYYSAGHIPLFVILKRASENRILPILSGGSILGINDEVSIAPISINLDEINPEAILLGTDGLLSRPTASSKRELNDLYEAIKLNGQSALDNIPIKDDKMLAFIDFRKESLTKNTSPGGSATVNRKIALA